MKQTLTALTLVTGVLAAMPAWAQSAAAPSTSTLPNTSGPVVRPQPSTAPAFYSQTAPAPMPATGASAEPATGAAAEPATDEAMPKRHAVRRHREPRHAASHATGGRHGKSANDNVANDLNRQEAARAASGAPPEPAAGTMTQGSSQAAPGTVSPSGAPSAPPPPR